MNINDLYMEALINCFIPFADVIPTGKTIKGLQATGLINKIYVLTTKAEHTPMEGCEFLYISALQASSTMKIIAAKADALYMLLYTSYSTLELGYFALERMVQLLNDSDAGMVYSDHYRVEGEHRKKLPVIDYQFGSLRDDFNFGPVLLYHSEAFREATDRMQTDYQYAGLYDLRLKLSQKKSLVHINEYLYT